MNRIIILTVLALVPATLIAGRITVSQEGRAPYRSAPTNNVPTPQEYEDGIATQITYYRSIDGSNGWAVARTSLGTEIKTPWYGSPTNSIAAILQSLADEDVKQKRDKETSGSEKKNKDSFDRLNNKDQIEYLRKRIEALEERVR